ncbi:hypothetical protein BGZ95_001264 [Linnemannia exigua]|uniref:Uncharacterized protein n=1 Tax=Linnemannia exigua TaxID=604196 RepID=A0AAD4D748_9FUNG|nr:hypothetical protein BGZ95_001264 [Linnemannia exigua]
MDGVKSISESTMTAVDMSIDFLEQTLEGDALADKVTNVNTGTQEKDMFSGLAALEGADLRRLDSFLRNRDADKILGNLYRITTDTGHVKWVCLDHYRQVYRETAMSSFLQCVESNGGSFDAHVGKVTVSLKSATAAKDFFNRLAQHGPAVTALNVTLDWSFGSADLAMIVDKTSQSNVRDFSFCTQSLRPLTSLGLFMRPGKGRYHSLLGLFSNVKIKDLTFANTDLIGLQTSSLPTSHSPSLLQSLHLTLRFSNSTDDTRAADIIWHCPHLVDLRLGAPHIRGYEVPKVDQAIGSLTKLAVLHRYTLHGESSSPPDIMTDTAPYGTVALRELVDFVSPYPVGRKGFLERAIRRSSDTLEVLMLQSKAREPLDLIELLYLRSVPMTQDLVVVLGVLALKHLVICYSGVNNMMMILQWLNLSQLQVLAIDDDGYDWAVEKVLAGRSAEFHDGFLVQLSYGDKAAVHDIHKEDARDLKGSPTRLARQRVRLMGGLAFMEACYVLTLPNFGR